MKASDRDKNQSRQRFQADKVESGKAAPVSSVEAAKLATEDDLQDNSATLKALPVSENQVTFANTLPLPANYPAIVLDAVKGNLEAFEQLYSLHVDQIYRYVYYRVTNQSDAEDLVAQVFLQAWTNIGSYKTNGSPFVAWLYTIAHNLVVNYYKKSERQAKLQMPLADWVADVQGPQDPYRELNTKLRNEALRRAIVKLGVEQQQIIYFRYVEDWSHQQIAALLGKTEAAVRVIQFRAQRTLRQFLEQDGWSENIN